MVHPDIVSTIEDSNQNGDLAKEKKKTAKRKRQKSQVSKNNKKQKEIQKTPQLMTDNDLISKIHRGKDGINTFRAYFNEYKSDERGRYDENSNQLTFLVSKKRIGHKTDPTLKVKGKYLFK